MNISLTILTLIGISVLIISCSNKKAENKTVMINPNEIVAGPIQHNELTDNQLLQIKSIHKTFEEVYSISLDETIINFKSDLNIDTEIKLWMNMKVTFNNVINVLVLVLVLLPMPFPLPLPPACCHV